MDAFAQSRARALARLRVCAFVFATLATGRIAGGGFREAPMLATKVAAGELPPVASRLPQNPLVVQPCRRIGRYGGTWKRLAINANDSLLGSRLGYEPLVRWDTDGRTVVPGLAESWEIRDGGRTYALRLRAGLKWSDGQPFTAADIMFWYEDIILNTELTPAFPTWLAPSGNRFTLTAPDPHHIVFTFDRPNGIFLEVLAFRGHSIYLPKHYLKAFHVHYTDKSKLETMAKNVGLDLWHQFFQDKSGLHHNPDRPTMRAWRIKAPPPASRLLAERNPYYWKVDPEGNQLPYIDRIAFTMVQNNEVLNLKAMTGSVDMQGRYIDSSKYTLFMENRAKGNYRVLANTAPGASCVYINQYSNDPEIRGLLQNPKFRIALSIAINRAELIEFIYAGLAEPANAVSGPFDPYYLDAFKDRHVEYDPARAARLLDEIGLRQNADGQRCLPNGKPFVQILHCYPSESGTGIETWQLVADYWREVGLHFVVKADARFLSVLQVQNGNSDFWAYSIPGIHWAIDPGWYVPIRDGAYFAPLYGRYYARDGRSGVPPSPEFQRLIELYREMAAAGDEARKLELGQRILQQWVEKCYVVGIARKKELTIVSNRFKNVPDQIIQDWRLMTPGYLNPEQFYLDETDTQTD